MGNNADASIHGAKDDKKNTPFGDQWLNACSFWYPEYPENSTWLEHAPFAFWLVDALRPRTVVELGTYKGFSYFCFCQAVKALSCDTRCFAIDTWQGDAHSGFYGEDVFRGVLDYNASHYDAFSSLMRSTFDAAAAHFSDGSVDLLHIDGCHFYESVAVDFSTWKRTLSDRSVVIFHDTNVRENDFGVHRLWDELRDQFPSFEFKHGHGLGVLGTGSSLPRAVVDFFEAAEKEPIRDTIREVYSRLGTARRSSGAPLTEPSGSFDTAGCPLRKCLPLSRITGNAAATSGLASGNDAGTKEIAPSSALMSQSAIVLYVPTPQVFGTGKQRLV